MIVSLTRRFDEVIPALQAHDMMVSRSGGLGELDHQEGHRATFGHGI